MIVRCQCCEWEGPIEEAIVVIPDLFQRVFPGEPMPAGECPTCGGLCHPVEAA